MRTTGYSTGPEIREWMTETTALFPLGKSIQYLSGRFDGESLAMGHTEHCDGLLIYSGYTHVYHLDNGNPRNV